MPGVSVPGPFVAFPVPRTSVRLDKLETQYGEDNYPGEDFNAQPPLDLGARALSPSSPLARRPTVVKRPSNGNAAEVAHTRRPSRGPGETSQVQLDYGNLPVRDYAVSRSRSPYADYVVGPRLETQPSYQPLHPWHGPISPIPSPFLNPVSSPPTSPPPLSPPPSNGSIVVPVRLSSKLPIPGLVTKNSETTQPLSSGPAPTSRPSLFRKQKDPAVVGSSDGSALGGKVPTADSIHASHMDGAVERGVASDAETLRREVQGDRQGATSNAQSNFGGAYGGFTLVSEPAAMAGITVQGGPLEVQRKQSPPKIQSVSSPEIKQQFATTAPEVLGSASNSGDGKFASSVRSLFKRINPNASSASNAPAPASAPTLPVLTLPVRTISSDPTVLSSIRPAMSSSTTAAVATMPRTGGNSSQPRDVQPPLPTGQLLSRVVITPRQSSLMASRRTTYSRRRFTYLIDESLQIPFLPYEGHESVAMKQITEDPQSITDGDDGWQDDASVSIPPPDVVAPGPPPAAGGGMVGTNRRRAMDLFELLEVRTLNEDECCVIFVQIVKAVVFMLKQRLSHGDIK
ncbi:hypothetical protein HK104_003854, partial [Borealophlyctis nickersoniae]